MNSHQAKPPYLLTDDLAPDDLDRLLSQPEVAMDTETLGLNPLRDRLCLVQICDSDGTINIIRNPNWRRAERLKAFLTSPVLKVFHYAVFDCSVLLASTGCEVARPYCTKIASKIARTYGAAHDLKTIVRELADIELPKDQQVSDWSGDLTDEQLEYAVNDVRFLLGMKHMLEDKLERRGSLATGRSFAALNAECQGMISVLVQLKLNGWSQETTDAVNVFAY